MSTVSVEKPNFFATMFACLQSLAFWFSFSGSWRPRTLSPPMARADSAAVVQLSIPPDNPMTSPAARVLSM